MFGPPLRKRAFWSLPSDTVPLCNLVTRRATRPKTPQRKRKPSADSGYAQMLNVR